MVCTGLTTSPSAVVSGPSLRIRWVFRSVTSALRSGRNVMPHGTSRCLASTVVTTFRSSAPRLALTDGVGSFGGEPAWSGGGGPKVHPVASRMVVAPTATGTRSRRPVRALVRLGRAGAVTRFSLASGVQRLRGARRPTRRDTVRPVKLWIAHEAGLSLLGPLPTGVEVEVYDGYALPGDPSTVEVWAPPFLAQVNTVSMIEKMPVVRLVQLLTAGADAWVGRLPEHVTLCDARGVHDSSTSEWTVAAILAYLRNFPAFARAQADREWIYGPTDELAGKRVLVVGAGSIGAAIARRLAPFD